MLSSTVTEQLVYLRHPGAKTAEPKTRPDFKELTAGEILQSEKKQTKPKNPRNSEGLTWS